MSAEQMHRTSHSAPVDAPAGVVYGLIADARQWPLFFPENVHVERLEFDGAAERLRMWATADGRVRSWISERALDPGTRSVEFRQTRPQLPLTAMSGLWTVEERPDQSSLVTLRHDYTVHTPGDAAWVERRLAANTEAQMAGIGALAERWRLLDDLVLSFEDAVRIEAPAEHVYDFLHRVDTWPALIPHVARLEVTEDVPGVQLMAMDTQTADGAVHTTESVRICFPHAGRIVYKQTVTPALMAAHTGEWNLVPDADGVTAVAQHNVVLREEAVERVLGRGADLAQARRHVREALGRNSTATLHLAKQHAELLTRQG